MSSAETSTWWRRNRRPLGAVLLGLVAAAGMFTVVDVLPPIQSLDRIQVRIADSTKDSVSLDESSVGPVGSQFFPTDVVAFSKPPAGSQAMWVTVNIENAPVECTLELTEVDGSHRTWLSATPLLDWDAPEDGPPTCDYQKEGEDYRLISAFALPSDAVGPFFLDVVVKDNEALVTRVARFTITPTLAEG